MPAVRVAGVLAGPDSDINIVAPSSAAQDRLSQPGVLRGGVAIKGGLSANMELNMASLSLFYDASVAPRLMHRKPR